MHAGRGLFGHALDCVALLGEPARRCGKTLLDLGEQDLFLFGTRIGQHVLAGFGAGTKENVHGGVAAIVEDHVGHAAVGPLEDLVRVFPILDQALTLDRKDGNAGGRDRGGCVILRREDVARCPAHFGAERDQRLDQDGGLDRHVQRAGDAGALQRLSGAEFGTAGHQARHFGFGNGNFLAAEIGKANVRDDVVVLSAHGILPARMMITQYRVPDRM